ncbi:MAG TPA: sigma-70 family RNA polymerase sigma factor [Bacteroidetes bacterium]|nr:sigma-70 family RNA polymerase sigma factor [Bacteroidota bacterium]
MYKTDENIIKGCRKGDRKSQQELYAKYKSMLFNCCLCYASGWHEAEDFLQDGLIRIFADLYQYKPTGELGAWMRKVMVNTCLQHLRKKKRMFQTVEVNEVADTFETDEDLFANYRAEALLKMVQQLPEGYRIVFNLSVMEEYTHKEIAEQLGIRPSASRSQLARAKAMLRKMLEKSVGVIRKT